MTEGEVEENIIITHSGEMKNDNNEFWLDVREYL